MGRTPPGNTTTICATRARVRRETVGLTLERTTLPKIGFISACCLVIANMIGAGVFTTSGYALQDLGHPNRVVLAWVIGGVIAICGAVSYGALVQRITESGGEYIFLSQVVHPFAGFLAGWISLWAGFTGAIAFAATTLEAYVWPDASGWVASALIVMAGGMHLAGLRVGAVGQNAIVSLKLLVIAAFLVLAAVTLPSLEPEVDLPAQPFSIRQLAMALVWISLSYSGFNAAVYLAGEVRDARRVVPRALLVGTLIVTLGYVALNAAFVYSPPASAIAGRQDVAAASAAILGGQPAELAMRVVICLALFSSLSAMLMAGPRVYAKMAADGVFPAMLALRDGRVPRAAIVLQVTLACLVCLATQLRELLDYLGFTLSLSAAATVSCLQVLRRREGAGRVPIPGGLAVPGFYILATLVLAALAASLKPWSLVGPLVTVASGWVAYLIFRRTVSDSRSEAIQ